MYAIKSIFLTLQGEGAHAGRPAVLVRFAGCNLWSGRDEDRAGGCSAWCDTDFRGGERLDAAAVAGRVLDLWPGRQLFPPLPFVVLTGGEPALQVDDRFLSALHATGAEVAMETNGSIPLKARPDWLTVSPKAGADLVVTAGDELKLPYPQAGAPPEAFARLPFSRLYLQPIDGPDRDANTAAAVAYCLAHPRWRLSLQTHKFLGIE